jgi:hypothetical protein
MVCGNYRYSHQIVFVAEDQIAMEHSMWQLVLLPRSNDVAILAWSCNPMFGGNTVYCHVCRGNNVWWQSVTRAQKSVTTYILYHNMEVLLELKNVTTIAIVTLDKCSSR